MDYDIQNDNLQEQYETNLPEFLQIDLDRYKQAQEDIRNGKEEYIIVRQNDILAVVE